MYLGQGSPTRRDIQRWRLSVSDFDGSAPVTSPAQATRKRSLASNPPCSQELLPRDATLSRQAPKEIMPSYVLYFTVLLLVVSLPATAECHRAATWLVEDKFPNV